MTKGNHGKDLSFRERVHREKAKLVETKGRQLEAQEKARAAAAAAERSKIAERQAAEQRRRKISEVHIDAVTVLSQYLDQFRGNAWIRVFESRRDQATEYSLVVEVTEPTDGRRTSRPVYRAVFNCHMPARPNDIGIKVNSRVAFSSIEQLSHFLHGRFENSLARGVAKIALRIEDRRLESQGRTLRRERREEDSNCRVASIRSDDIQCQECRGSGLKGQDLCTTCEGYGEVAQRRTHSPRPGESNKVKKRAKSGKRKQAVCTRCAGVGQLGGARCEVCGGSGDWPDDVGSAEHVRRMVNAAIAGQLSHEAISNLIYSGNAYLSAEDLGFLRQAMLESKAPTLNEGNAVTYASTIGQD